jgi:hypothetical protein
VTAYRLALAQFEDVEVRRYLRDFKFDVDSLEVEKLGEGHLRNLLLLWLSLFGLPHMRMAIGLSVPLVAAGIAEPPGVEVVGVVDRIAADLAEDDVPPAAAFGEGHPLTAFFRFFS